MTDYEDSMMEEGYATGFKERTDFAGQLQSQLNLVRIELSKFHERSQSLQSPDDALRVLIVMVQNKRILEKVDMNAEEFAKKLKVCDSGGDRHDTLLKKFQMCQDILDEADLLGLDRTIQGVIK